jgi:hypothetical protein
MEQNIDTLGINIQPNNEKKAILLYDTEQSETQLYKNISVNINNLAPSAKNGARSEE